MPDAVTSTSSEQIARGLAIVLDDDVVVATTRAAFGLAEVTRNLIAGVGSCSASRARSGARLRWR